MADYLHSTQAGQNVTGGAQTFAGAKTFSTGIVGKTDGAAIGAGYVGEVKEITNQSRTLSTINSNAWQDKSPSGLLLTPGVWIIMASADYSAVNANVLNVAIGFSTAISAPSDISNANCNMDFFANNTLNYNAHLGTKGLHVVSLNANATYYIWYRGFFGAGTLAFITGTLRAIRIA